MAPAVWIWLALGLAFLILEIFTPGFIFACFVIGAVAAAGISLLVDSYLIQAVAFAVVSLILIPLTRPLAQKITRQSPVKINVDALIGKTGIVRKKVNATGGQILVDEQVWQARSEAVIGPGKRVRVLAIEGAKLIVEPLEE